jgi:Tfp pilus assembly protein PilV
MGKLRKLFDSNFHVSTLANDQSSQSVNNSQNAKRDEVLKRMLKMLPKPHKMSDSCETSDSCEVRNSQKLADSKVSERNVSARKSRDGDVQLSAIARTSVYSA